MQTTSNYIVKLPRDLYEDLITKMSIQDVIHLAFSLERVAGSSAMSLLTMKFGDAIKNLTDVEKSEEGTTRDVATLIRVICHFHEIGISFISPHDVLLNQGYCYTKELKKPHWLHFCGNFIGEFPNPWLVRCIYMAQEGLINMPLATKVRSEHRMVHGGLVNCACAYCKFVLNVLRDNPRKLDLAPVSERLVFKQEHPRGINLDSEVEVFLKAHDVESEFHFIGIHHHTSMDWDSEERLRSEHGSGFYTTMKFLRQRQTFFSGRVGTPETVILRDDSGAENAESTVYPNESASFITPRINTVNKQSDDIMSQLTSQIAELRTSISNLNSKTSVGDYSRDEYDLDLYEAFESSGVVKIGDDNYLRPLANTNACDLVPRITIDDRLNFLIRLHTAIFRVVPNDQDYPAPGISHTLKKAMEGKLPDDHPSFDLLQIVVTDTFDWNHQIVKNNNFLLPIIERGMKFNERIIALCLGSLKDEYSTRWRSLVKDCILPSDIMDTSRWSDKYDKTCGMRITAKRPDLAMKDREPQRRNVKPKRRDSIFGR